jgi:hypothetical protein
VRRENGIEPQQFELKDVENEEAAGGEDFWERRIKRQPDKQKQKQKSTNGRPKTVIGQ